MLKKFTTTKILILIIYFFLVSFLIHTPKILAADSNKVYFTPQIAIPNSSISGTIDVSSIDSDGNINSSLLARYVIAIYDYGLSIAGILAAIMLMAGGIIWLTSGGDSGKVDQAKKIIIGSISGLFILISANLILNTINPQLVNMKGIPLIVPENITFFKATCCTPKAPETYTVKNVDGKNIIMTGEKKGQEFKCDYEICASDQLCTLSVKTNKYSCTANNSCCECVEFNMTNPNDKSTTDLGCWDNISSESCEINCSKLGSGLRVVTPYYYDANTHVCKTRRCVKK